MKKNTTILLILLIFSLFFTSCEPKVSKISSDKCEAPCWRNIVPGVTSQKEAEALVHEFTDVKERDLVFGGENGIFNGVTSLTLKNGISIEIYYINGIVTKINFYKSSGISRFEQCVTEYGTPEFIGRSFRYGPGLPIGATSAMHPWIFAILAKKGVVFGYDAYQFFSDELVLSPSNQIILITYYDVNLFRILLEYGEIVKTDGAERLSEEDLFKWIGYGDIEILYPQR